MGSFPIHMAVQCDLVRAAELLQEEDLNLNVNDAWDATPLHWAAGSNSVEGVRLLLSAGANWDCVTALGHTPLGIAAEEGNPQSMQVLLEAGAAVDSIDGSNEICPLLVACFNDNVEAVRVLLDAGASFKVTNGLGYTPMAVACLQGSLPVAQLLSSCGAARRFRLFEEVEVFAAGNGPKAAFALLPEKIAHVNNEELAQSARFTKVDTEGAAAKAAQVDGMFAQPLPPEYLTAEMIAAAKGHNKLAAWLAESRDWRPLQHLQPLAQTRHQDSLRAHMPAMTELHAHLTEAAAGTWELPSKELLDRALESFGPGGTLETTKEQYAEAADVTRADHELSLMQGYDHGGGADPSRRKRVFIANMLQTCMRFMNTCALGPQLSPERAAALLASGANIHATSADGTSPLSLAQAMSVASAVESGSAADLVLQHHAAQASPADEVGAEVAMAKCSGCEAEVPKADFSAMQMKKKGKRKCKGCIVAQQ